MNLVLKVIYFRMALLENRYFRTRTRFANLRLQYVARGGQLDNKRKSSARPLSVQFTGKNFCIAAQ